MSAILRCENLVKKYGSTPALTNFNLELEPGRVVGLLGPNGSGKTTLIKLIAGLLTPASGRVLVNDMPIGIETKKIVSYLPERTYISDWMKVKDIFKMFEDFYPDFNVAKANDMLSRLGIKIDDRVKAMSKGTKEKLQLILVMAREARLYLLDEPIGGVDPAAREYILDTIISNYSENSTVIISTHLISDIERVLDDIIFLKYGQLSLFGDADSIREGKGMSIEGLFKEVFRC